MREVIESRAYYTTQMLDQDFEQLAVTAKESVCS